MAIYMKLGYHRRSRVDQWVRGLDRAQLVPVGRRARLVNSRRGRGHPRGSEPSISEIVVTKRMDKASTKLWQDAVGGDFSATVTYQVHHHDEGQGGHVPRVRAHRTAAERLQHHPGGGDAPNESLSLNFTKIMFTYTERDPKVAGSPDTVGYDLLTMGKV